MDTPPLPAVIIGAGLVLNYRRSRRRQPGKRTVSRWACRNKKAAVTVAVGFSLWWVTHWVLYVVELPESVGGSA